MKKIRSISGLVLLLIALAGLPAGKSSAAEESRYLKAVREFADNVLKYGRDTYGPKHTPLFVDGLNIHTHEPVKWIAPNGDRWILSNLASQQNLFRTLDGLTKITGDPKYKQAAMDAIKYAFANLRSPNGLLYWGAHSAYDALGDVPCRNGTHELKGFYPYYELMWQINPEATKQFVKAFWSAHIIDWSNLDMDRIGSLETELEEPWKHEYKGGPVFFESRGRPFITTGCDLYYAAAALFNFSREKEPLVWGTRLAYRYIETRDPKIGISSYVYSLPKDASGHPLADDFKGHVVYELILFPPQVEQILDPIVRKCKLGYFIVSLGIPYSYVSDAWICYLLVGELLGTEGKEFTQWALEDLTARGKVAYRKKDNVWIPMLPDGTSLEGYAYKKDELYGPKGTVFKPISAVPMDFWGYALAYRLTNDEFMWEMTRNIAQGNGLGDIGATPENKPKIQIPMDHFDPYTLLAFLELYRKTGVASFLQAAQKVGDNIMSNRFHNGFFVPSSKHIYAKFDAIEALVLLHLDATIRKKGLLVPQVWSGRPFFNFPFRDKDVMVDNALIYTLTESPEPPRSLQEAAACGDVEEVKSLIAQGDDVNSRESIFLDTPLYRAALNSRKEVIDLLLAKGAWIDVKGSLAGDTALHCAAEKGHKEIVELLIAKGADINAKDNRGQTPLDVAMSQNRKDIVELLMTKGATVSIHAAAQAGDLAGVKASLEGGTDINVRDNRGFTSLHYAVQGGHKEVAEFLIAKGADVNAKNNRGRTPLDIAKTRNRKDIVQLFLAKGADINSKGKSGYTPLYYAIWNEDKDMVKLLVSKGADVNWTSQKDYPPLHYAVWSEDIDLVKLIVAKGAKFDVKDQDGWTAFRYAVSGGNRELVEFFVDKGADVSTFHMAACMGDLARVKSFVEQGTEIDTKDELGWTPLYWAVSTAQEDVTEFLINKGANVDAKTNNNRTPLHQASQAGAAKLVELFLSKGADVNAKDKEGSTPLHSASKWEVAELLIAKGADVNAKSENGQTPLHSAARRGQRDIVEILLAKGADVNAKDKQGRTPLGLAERRGHKEIVELLRKHGAKE